MTCEAQAAGAIELYFYGELAPTDRADTQSHLKRCAECRRALEDLSMIRAALGSRPDVATPPGGDWSAFMARLDESVRQVQQASAGEIGGRTRAAAPLPGRIVPYLALAAMLALVTVSVLFVIGQRD
ncbi:MAG: anti-sigma factor family protein, partial [Vicinamibacterales bacterium]